MAGDDKNMDMRGKDNDDAAPKSPEQAVKDDTPDNFEVVNFESIKANLVAALAEAKRLGIDLGGALSSLATQTATGLNKSDLQAAVATIASGERAAGAVVVQREVGDLLSPFKDKSTGGPDGRGINT